jgi:hypothetical protein
LTSALEEVSGKHHTSAALTPVKGPQVPLYRRLGRPQNQSGCSGEEKNSQPLLGLESLIIQPIAQFYSTELSWLSSIIIVVSFN